MTAHSKKIALSLPWAMARGSLVVAAPMILEIVLQNYLHLPRLVAFIVAGICFADRARSAEGQRLQPFGATLR